MGMRKYPVRGSNRVSGTMMDVVHIPPLIAAGAFILTYAGIG
jgi:hypothetical protein